MYVSVWGLHRPLGLCCLVTSLCHRSGLCCDFLSVFWPSWSESCTKLFCVFVVFRVLGLWFVGLFELLCLPQFCESDLTPLEVVHPTHAPCEFRAHSPRDVTHCHCRPVALVRPRLLEMLLFSRTPLGCSTVQSCCNGVAPTPLSPTLPSYWYRLIVPFVDADLAFVLSEPTLSSLSSGGSGAPASTLRGRRALHSRRHM